MMTHEACLKTDKLAPVSAAATLPMAGTCAHPAACIETEPSRCKKVAARAKIQATLKQLAAAALFNLFLSQTGPWRTEHGRKQLFF